MTAGGLRPQYWQVKSSRVRTLNRVVRLIIRTPHPGLKECRASRWDEQVELVEQPPPLPGGQTLRPSRNPCQEWKRSDTRERCGFLLVRFRESESRNWRYGPFWQPTAASAGLNRESLYGLLMRF